MSDRVRLDDLPWGAGAAGIGALLMIDPVLPRDHFGHPYQPLFWFDEQSRPIGMVVDRENHIVAWENNAEGNPVVAEDATCQRVPAEVAQAAWDWWYEQLET